MPVILFWQHKQLLTFLRISENSKKSICYGVLLLSKASLKASLNQASLKASLNLREFSLFLTNTQQNSCLSRTSLPEVFLGKDVLKTCRKSIAEHPCRSVISIKLFRSFRIAFAYLLYGIRLGSNFEYIQILTATGKGVLLDSSMSNLFIYFV